MGKQYGSYVKIASEPETEQEKIEYVRLAVNKLLDDMKDWPVPNLNTLQLIIHEGVEIWGGPDWYEEEKEDYTPSLPRWGMTVGIKYTEKE